MEWRRPLASRSRVSRSLGSLLVVASILLIAASMTWAHPAGQGAVRAALLDWAQAIATADAGRLEALLAEEFRLETYFGAAGDRPGVVAMLAEGTSSVEAIDLRHAQYHVQGDEARVRDVLATVLQTTRVALEVTLVRRDDAWRLLAVRQQPELPAPARRVHPEALAGRRVVELEIREAGEPVWSRVSVVDAEGAYWPPEGHVREVATGWREDVGFDVVVAGRTFAYVPGRTRLRLPPGEYDLAVRRGPEVVPARRRFRVEADADASLRVDLERWSDVRREGWVAADTHVHFVDPEAAMAEVLGEDLHVLNLLASKWGPLVTNVRHFSGTPSPSSRPGRLVYVGEETRHGWLGHSILLGIERLVYPLTWGGPSEGVPGGFDHPPMATQADAAHAQGGLVTAAHFPWPNGELAVDVALGKLDAVDLFTWGDAFSDRNPMPAPPAVATWYRYLNAGFDLPATAGTDKMHNTQVSGSVRVYAKLADEVLRAGGEDGGFAYADWLAAVRAGRTFVTTGPMLRFAVDGRGIGDRIDAERGVRLRARAEVHSRIPVEWLEIVANGRVVARVENPERRTRLVLEVDHPVEGSSWLAARAWSSERLPYQAFPVAGLPPVPLMAHTSPVYVDVEGAPRRSPEDARVLLGWVEEAIDWARSRARFAEPRQRDEMVALFERAARVYRARLAPSGAKP